MTLDDLRTYCLAKSPHVTESLPFGPDVLVFKIDKMFALVNIEGEPHRVNLKCDPERATELRDRFPDDILPGYHMNKQHWNTVNLEGAYSDDFLRGLIDDSYGLIVSSLTKRRRGELGF